MKIEIRDKFIRLWAQFFNNSELPITFQYASESRDIPVVETPKGHRCIISQLLKVRHGESVCFEPTSVPCIGGKRYLMFTDSMPPNFECYISHYPDGRGERYKRHPEQMAYFWDNLPKLPTKGDHLFNSDHKIPRDD